MPIDALPENLQSPDAWKGTDMDNPWQRWFLKYQGWFAFGPRCRERWARWREAPKRLLALGGAGHWRWEWDDSDPLNPDHHVQGLYQILPDGYLSRVQYWKRWHFQFAWPLFFAFHIYWSPASVPPLGERPDQGDGLHPLNIRKLLMGYVGFRRDSDRVYWLSFFLGGKFK